jgi:hypothetical protein
MSRAIFTRICSLSGWMTDADIYRELVELLRRSLRLFLIELVFDSPGTQSLFAGISCSP